MSITKTENFHNTLRVLQDKFFPVKSIKISQLDKKWLNPMLKSLNRKVQREFYKNRKSNKWKTLKKKFKKLKRERINTFYADFKLEGLSNSVSNEYPPVVDGQQHLTGRIPQLVSRDS